MTNKLKELILKKAKEDNVGIDLDGDIIKIFDKKYYVNYLNYEVEEIK